MNQLKLAKFLIIKVTEVKKLIVSHTSTNQRRYISLKTDLCLTTDLIQFQQTFNKILKSRPTYALYIYIYS
jgi:hypothetical protein